MTDPWTLANEVLQSTCAEHTIENIALSSINKKLMSIEMDWCLRMENEIWHNCYDQAITIFDVILLVHTSIPF